MAPVAFLPLSEVLLKSAGCLQSKMAEEESVEEPVVITQGDRRRCGTVLKGRLFTNKSINLFFSAIFLFVLHKSNKLFMHILYYGCIILHWMLFFLLGFHLSPKFLNVQQCRMVSAWMLLCLFPHGSIWLLIFLKNAPCCNCMIQPYFKKSCLVH